MKQLISLFILSILIPNFSMADEQYPDYTERFFKPNISLGLGVEFNTGYKTASYGMLVAKSYVAELGDKSAGFKILGGGISVDSSGKWSFVLAPVCYEIAHICVGPELLIPSLSESNFGVTLSYGF